MTAVTTGIPVEVSENAPLDSLATVNLDTNQLYTRPVTLYTKKDFASMTYRNEDNTLINISHGYNKTLAALEKLGHLFDHLMIKMGPEAYDLAEKLSEYINKYCTRAYLEVELIRGYQNDDVNILLKNYTNVKITHISGTTAMDKFYLDESFPRLQKLDIDYEMEIDHHFPNLTNFIYIPIRFYDIYMSYLDEFIELNPQLRSIHTSLYYDTNFLATMSTSLPNLESLSLRTIEKHHLPDGTAEVAHFPNVIDLSLDVRNGKAIWTDRLKRLLESIHCPRLESITISSRESFAYPFLFELLWKNKGLRSVTIISSRPMNVLVDVNSRLPQLKEFTVQSPAKKNLPKLNELLVGATTLDSVNIRLDKSSIVKYADIVEQVPMNWSHSLRPIPESKYAMVELRRRSE